MNKILLSLTLCLSFCFSSLRAQSCQDASVELSAAVQANPPRITLNWVANAGATGYTVNRKLKNSANWGAALGAPAATDTQYIDTTAKVGTNYEYRVVRAATAYTGYGYINAGIEIPLVESRGNLVLVIDQTMKDTLRKEIEQLIQDIEGDGWNVQEIDVDRAASPVVVKTAIKALYDVHPAKTKSVFLLGHVPVPYSGDLNPDGHPDHLGAWPADVYYADMNGTWTDNAVNDIGAGDERNRNEPGDGKYDQSLIPTDVELQVGRVDFSNMPSFALSESELLRQYLNKDHAFRQKMFTAVSRGLVDDNFGYFGGEAFASTGYKNIGPIVGPENVTANDYLTAMADSSYLWSYGCGGGWFQGAGGIGSTADFANSHTQGVFTMLFGSYFGDWDSQDNFLRAPLAQGLTLTNAWSGRPHWVFHPMGLGETVGYCAKLTQNNNATYFASYGARFVSIALMGDPSLRNDIIAPASNLVVTNQGYHVKLIWDPSADGILGYNLYRKATGDEDFVRINNAPITKTEFVDSCLDIEGEITYMVRALNLQHTPSGSYYNMSEGIAQKINHDGTPDVSADATFTQEGQVVTFTNTSVGAVDHILWLFGDGDTSAEQNPVHQYHDGTYQAAIIVSNECLSDTFYLDVQVLTGTKEFQDDSPITLFPNPSTGKINILTPKDNEHNMDIHVYSPEGILLYHHSGSLPDQIDLSGYPVGLYIATMKAGEKTYMQKINLQR